MRSGCFVTSAFRNLCSEIAVRTASNARLFLRALATALLLPLTLPLFAEDDKGGYRLLELDGYKVKWGEQTLGAGASISYAFADASMQFDNARNCRELVPMAALTGHALSVDVLEREATAAFRAWERAANVTFHKIDDPREADIVLGAQGQPVGTAFANVTYLPGSEDNVRLIDQALVCLNPEKQWKVGFDGDKDVYDIRYTLIHEIGHAIGLDHPGPEGQLMGFRYTEAFADLQPGDLRGIRQLYGPAADKDRLAVVDTDTHPAETQADHVSSADAPDASRSMPFNEL